MPFTSTLPLSGVPYLDRKLQKVHDTFYQKGLLFFDEYMEGEEKLLMNKRGFEVSFIFYSVLTHYLSVDIWDNFTLLNCDRTKPYWRIHHKLIVQGIRNYGETASDTDFLQQFERRRNRFIAECVSVSDNHLIKNIVSLTYFYFHKPCDFNAPLLDALSQEQFWKENKNVGDAADLIHAVKAVFKELEEITTIKEELVGEETSPFTEPTWRDVKTDPVKQPTVTGINQHPLGKSVAVVTFDDGSEAFVSIKYFTGTNPAFLNHNNQLQSGWYIKHGWIMSPDSQKMSGGLTDIPLMATGLAPHPESDKVVIVTFDNGQRAIASTTEHFKDDCAVFLDRSNNLLPEWTIINDWIAPVPKPISSGTPSVIPLTVTPVKNVNPLDSLRAAQLSAAFIELYAAEYGMKKAEVIYNKVRFSSKMAKYIDHLKTQKLDPGVDGFLAILNSIPYFIFSKGETLCMGALIAINKWLEVVEYTPFMPSEERLHQIVRATILKTEATKMHISGSNFFDKYFALLKEQMQES